MSTYSQLLKDPRWQKVRLKKLEAAGWSCERCYGADEMLSVHHKRYVKGRKPWEYPEHELAVLCQPCHEMEHEEKECRQNLIGALHVDGPAGAADFFAVGAGYIGHQTNDRILHAAALDLAGDNPFQYESGRFLAVLLDSCFVSQAGLTFMADELLSASPSSFREELHALLAKHNVLARPAEGL